MLSKAEAEARFGFVWDARFHIVVAPGTAEPPRDVDISNLIDRLEFEVGVAKWPRDLQQSFRSLRRPTEQTVQMLREIWFGDQCPDLKQLEETRGYESGDNFDPKDQEDARKRILAEIIRRQGQG